MEKIILTILIVILAILLYFHVPIEQPKVDIEYYKDFYVWVADNHEDVFIEYFEPRQEDINEMEKEIRNDI